MMELIAVIDNLLPDERIMRDASRTLCLSLLNRIMTRREENVNDHLLCRAPHNTCYAESRIMPSKVGERA